MKKPFRFAMNPDRRALFDLPHVVGVGTGYKRVRGEDTGQSSVIVFVDRKFPPGTMSRSAMIPPEVDGLPTDVVEIGRLKALRPSADTVARTGRVRPAPGGVSVGHPDITAGTLGVMVWEQSSGKALMLSNNHVLANSSSKFVGKPSSEIPILQPGPYDGGTVRNDAIGRLYRFVPLKRFGINRFDAALALPYSPNDLSPEIMGLGRVAGVAEPALRQAVQKSGRTSGITSGKIIALDAHMQVEYDQLVLFFADLILADLKSEGGDSGSLIVDDHMNAVGLLFAGSDRVTAMMPIIPLSKALGFGFSPPGREVYDPE